MVKLTLGEKVLFAEKGEKLSEVLIKSGLSFSHPCGGKGRCRKCAVKIDGKEELSCRYIIEKDVFLELADEGEILSESGEYEKGEFSENAAFVLDLGSTTLALALVNLESGKITALKSCSNPQRIFGADVISRIDYCKKNSTEPLQRAVISAVNSLIGAFGLTEKKALYLSGNATMLHIFFGADPSGMGTAPYNPVFLEEKRENGEALGLFNIGEVISLPSVSAFAGADIVAGLNYLPEPKRGKFSLLVDLGTNAEIALFSKDKILCTAAAAGPCFEGANIACGMSAMRGAVYEVSPDFKLKTIENAEPLGICGTGLIDIIAVLLEKGIIDETGYMEEDFKLSENVFLRREDVREFQLAKSAVHSGIIALMKRANLAFEDIEALYISGGFSEKMKVENAARTGLLPPELTEKTKAVGNSSLMGTVKYAKERNNLSSFTEKATYVDLSSDSAFSELFMENMIF